MKIFLHEKKKNSFPATIIYTAVIITIALLLMTPPAEAAKEKSTCSEAHFKCLNQCRSQASSSFHMDCFAQNQPWQHCGPHPTWKVEEESCMRGCAISAEECNELAKQNKEKSK